MKARALILSAIAAVVLAVSFGPLVDYGRARACVNQFIRSTATAEPKCDTVLIDTDTDKKFGGVAVTATGTEINRLAGVTPGTAAASKAAVLGADKNLDALAVADGGFRLGAGAGTPVTATAVELNETLLPLDIADLSADTTYYMVMPHAGTIGKIWSVIDGAVATADVTITANIGATPMTNGVVTIATAASAAGDVDSATPSAANVVTAGQAINLVVAGGGAGGSPRGHVVVVLTR